MKDKYFLLSHALSGKTPTYGNRDKLSVISNSSITEGATANSFSIHFSTNHMGTHIDFPLHFKADGKSPLDVELNYWFFNRVELIDIPTIEGKLITVEDISKYDLNKNLEILLIRTGFEKYRQEEKYWKYNPGIHSEVGHFLIENFSQIRTVGFDFISLTSFKHREHGKIAHNAFLNHEEKFVSIIEDMRLSNYDKEINEIIVSPLFIEGIDSSPVSVLGKIKDVY